MTKLMKKSLSLFLVAILAISWNGCKKEDTKVRNNPAISWATPADITYGALLSAKQLNATADVPGTFVYTPPIGTLLELGNNQPLKVVFSPANSDSFNTVSKTVSINVLVPGQSNAVFNTALSYGSMSDVEGNVYKTITIGTQTWMAENLRTTAYRNGDPIPEVSDNSAWKNLNSHAYCNYENIVDKDKIATYGRLYNWFAVTDSRNLAPTGWHVATDAEWTSLTTLLGGETVAGGKLKETGFSHWTSPNTAATNASGFTAISTGRREYTDGSFINLGFDGFWWTSSSYDPNYSWYRYLHYDVANIYRANFHKQYGFSVRCVKD